PLISGGMGRCRAVLVCAATGAPTVLGAAAGYFLGTLGPRALSLALSFASGAMLYVVFGELLPEAGEMWKSRLPALAAGAMESVGSMLGPISMIIIGMLMAGVDLKRVIRIPGVWKVTLLRLIVYPLVILLVLKYSGIASLLSLLLVRAGLGTNVDLVTIGVLMLLVPGVALTNAMREIVAGDTYSGLSRTAEAILIAMGIALGAAVGLGIGYIL
ncbi:threonine/serine exporter family protein, partial [uncultured Oscillibacter sp.]|uniref:threonine/serine exporter family protein n=1 Tax=uncultured Oscillibacter sp. TaxID=876091 RepID=UPI0025F72900